MINFMILTNVAMAALLSGSLGQKQIDLTVNGEKTSLTLAGQGLRSKKVVFVNVEVYDAFLYLKDPTTFKRTTSDALTSLDSQTHWVMALKFRRDVDGGKIQQSFKEAFDANKISTDTPAFKDFLQAVKSGGEVKKGQSLLITGLKKGTEDVVMYENGEGKLTTVTGPTGFLHQVLSIWFGTMSEDKMTDLKNALLKAP